MITDRIRIEYNLRTGAVGDGKPALYPASALPPAGPRRQVRTSRWPPESFVWKLG